MVGLAEANPAGYREHGRFQIQTGGAPTWSHPIVSNGKLFIRDQDNIYAFDVRQKIGRYFRVVSRSPRIRNRS